MRNLGILIRMQLKSLADRSLLSNKRSFLLKAGVSILLFALVTIGYYVVFTISSLLSVFSLGAGIPDTVVSLLFTVIQLMSVYSCMTGLGKALYRGGDNVTLLVLPVPQSLVFLSKLAVYYVYELKRGLMLTVTLFLAYGIVSNAAWFYYPWMLFCFLFVSLLPVAAGAVLSILAHYVPRFLSRIPAVKYLLIFALVGAIVAAVFYVIGLIPENINIIGQWGSITRSIRNFLNTFATVFYPWHMLTLMMVGGSLAIARNPITPTGGAVFAVNLGICALLIGLAFLTARKLFLKMTAQAGEVRERRRKARPNRVHSAVLSPLFEDVLRSARSGKAIWRYIMELFVPAILIFALNRIYAAMNTSLSGEKMTAAFNILVLLVSVLTANTFLAHVYSRDGSARDLLKTRPVDFRLQLTSRLVLRAAVSTLAVAAAAVIYRIVAGVSVEQAAEFAGMAVCVNLAHIFWCAEIDVMNAESKQSVGNETKATMYAVLLAVLFTAGYYLISGSTGAFLKLLIVAAAFLALRAFLYFERVKFYFIGE